MEKTLTIYPNGSWMVETPHATGSDFGPGRYYKGNEATSWEAKEELKANLEYYKKAGVKIIDKRVPVKP